MSIIWEIFRKKMAKSLAIFLLVLYNKLTLGNMVFFKEKTPQKGWIDYEKIPHYR